MVRGIAKFKEYFEGYAGQYVFIGGTACDLILGKIGVDFRQTKDFDMVLIIEALNDAFVETFISFIEEGEYQHVRKGTGTEQFYRFEKPMNMQFPYMIELFSRKPDHLLSLNIRLAPIHISDDILSLSAILLDDDYYSLLVEGIVEIEGMSVLDLKYLILFKMKAWLDLSVRKTNGESIDSRDIKKHKNDILRLAANIEAGQSITINERIRTDVNRYLEQAEHDNADVKNLGIRGVTCQEILDRIKMCYSV